MGKTAYYLERYPFDEIKDACESYIRSFDWDKISDDVREKKVVHFDVSDCIDIFKHLQLDEDYQLICYVSKEYHGMLGKTVALKKGQPQEARHKGFEFGFNVELPETAADPMEVIYSDGTAEGYLEAVLFSKFLHDMPNYHFLNHEDAPVISSLPDDILKIWDIFVDVTDLRPKLFVEEDNVSLYIFRRKYAGVFAPTDGRDEIILYQYNFDKYGFAHRLSNHKVKKFKEHPSNYLRKNYSEIKRCCMFAVSEICAAKQKKVKQTIIVNAIKCTCCGDIIESTPEEPEVTCSCGRCTVEGGHDHISRTYRGNAEHIEMSVIEEVIGD